MEEEPKARAKPDERDVHAGVRLRQRRTELGMSQERLADAVGVTFQQIQKYERGVNRISISRVSALARVLEVPVEYFFTADTAPTPAYGFADQQDAFGDDPPRNPDTEELLRAFARIVDPNVRRRVLDLIRSLAPPAGD